jgi:hypothetical protein
MYNVSLNVSQDKANINFYLFTIEIDLIICY